MKCPLNWTSWLEGLGAWSICEAWRPAQMPHLKCWSLPKALAEAIFTSELEHTYPCLSLPSAHQEAEMLCCWKEGWSQG